MSFVIIEGPNGVGKTSLIKKLNENGVKTLSSPNGTPLAQMLRPACRGTDQWKDLDPRIKFLLFSGARLDEYIRIVKDSKELVVADRWWTSTYIYQCCFEGFDTNFLEYTIHPQERIDMVIGLDAEDDILLTRMRLEREKNITHGICSWTQDTKVMSHISNLYRNELPKYLKLKNIPYRKVNVSAYTLEDTYNHVMNIMDYEI